MSKDIVGQIIGSIAEISHQHDIEINKMVERGEILEDYSKYTIPDITLISKVDYLFLLGYGEHKIKCELLSAISDNWYLKRFDIEVVATPSITTYGIVRIVLCGSPKLGSTILKSTLSDTETYQQNKTRQFCIRCGKKTEPKAILSSIVQYCNCVS